MRRFDDAGPDDVARLRQRLAEAEDVLRALRAGQVDAILVDTSDGREVMTLSSTERPYRQMVEQMSEGAAMLTSRGRVVYANHHLAALLGVPLERLVGSELSRFVSELDRSHLRLLLRRGEGALETDLVTPDERVAPVKLSVARMGTDETVSRCVVITDLTHQKDHERLRSSEIRLRDAVAQLEQSHRHKNEFLAILGHELRNPLAPIRAAVDLLGSLEDPDPRVLRVRDVIDRQCRQLTRLVDDLLDISRISRGRLQLQRSRVLLHHVIEEGVEASRPNIEANRHILIIEQPNEVIALLGDRGRLVQVVANLLNNAAAYTPPEGRIHLETVATPRSVRLRVSDNGMGMTRDFRERVFDLFSRAPEHQRTTKGLGLGLSLVRRIVELHDGSVEAASDGPSQGSVFTVTLPRIVSEPVIPPSPDAPRLHAAPTRVLIVDDNADAAALISELLEAEGHTTRIAHAGLAALDLARAFEPRVVTLDLGLPDIDGYEVARHLRGQWPGRPLLIVAVTGYGGAEVRARCQDAGIDYHLTKPLSITTLQRLLVQHQS